MRAELDGARESEVASRGSCPSSSVAHEPGYRVRISHNHCHRYHPCADNQRLPCAGLVSSREALGFTDQIVQTAPL
jgi:hypothetical protein